jgi:hypothetical protein
MVFLIVGIVGLLTGRLRILSRFGFQGTSARVGGAALILLWWTYDTISAAPLALIRSRLGFDETQMFWANAGLGCVLVILLLALLAAIFGNGYSRSTSDV